MACSHVDLVVEVGAELLHLLKGIVIMGHTYRSGGAGGGSNKYK